MAATACTNGGDTSNDGNSADYDAGHHRDGATDSGVRVTSGPPAASGARPSRSMPGLDMAAAPDQNRSAVMTSVSLSPEVRPGGGGGGVPPLSLRHSAPPTPGGAPLGPTGSTSVIDDLREWSLSTYKVTRQLMSERLGRASRTVDSELEAQIADLRETQHKYTNVLQLTQALTLHFHRALQTQKSLGDVFGDMSQKNPELREEFSYNAETQRVLFRNGETLLRALNMFTSTLNTLCNKTITDTLLTVKNYEQARIEYDAYRSDVESLTGSSQGQTVSQKLYDTQARYKQAKEKYERLRADVAIKLKFLDENRVKVMHKQLLLFHNAVAAYFSGNQIGLEETLKQFSIRMKTPTSEKLSTFLEKGS